MQYENKYNLTRAQSLFLLKKNMVDFVWKSALLEGINVTYPKTYAILEKAELKDVKMDEALKIINLKHAWEYIISAIDEPITLDYICKINYEIARDESLEWGKLRTGQVGIGGTDYKPPIPVASEVEGELAKFSENSTENAIKFMLWLMRAQLFWDGNKRTAMICANKIMLQNGFGIISVPENKIEEFNEKLSNFYETNKSDDIIKFVYDNCIYGIE
jgi:Fic family protein